MPAELSPDERAEIAARHPEADHDGHCFDPYLHGDRVYRVPSACDAARTEDESVLCGYINADGISCPQPDGHEGIHGGRIKW